MRSPILWFLMFLSAIICIKGQVIKGRSLIEKQLLCALDRAPCDILGSQIKEALPEIIGNNCRSCDNRQLSNARRIAVLVQSKYPDVWNALVQKYSSQSS